MNNWLSSVLTCDVGDDDCPICRFVSGSRDIDTLMEVIEVLDKTLYNEETYRRNILGSILEKANK